MCSVLNVFIVTSRKQKKLYCFVSRRRFEYLASFFGWSRRFTLDLWRYSCDALSRVDAIPCSCLFLLFFTAVCWARLSFVLRGHELMVPARHWWLLRNIDVAIDALVWVVCLCGLHVEWQRTQPLRLNYNKVTLTAKGCWLQNDRIYSKKAGNYVTSYFLLC